jgi:hypothetical protein
MRSREDAEGSEGRPHLQYRQFDGGPSMAVATAHPCCCRPREQLGKSRGEVVQSTTRIWLSDPRPTDARYFYSYENTSALRFH